MICVLFLFFIIQQLGKREIWSFKPWMSSRNVRIGNKKIYNLIVRFLKYFSFWWRDFQIIDPIKKLLRGVTITKNRRLDVQRYRECCHQNKVFFLHWCFNLLVACRVYRNAGLWKLCLFSSIELYMQKVEWDYKSQFKVQTS